MSVADFFKRAPPTVEPVPAPVVSPVKTKPEPKAVTQKPVVTKKELSVKAEPKSAVKKQAVKSEPAVKPDVVKSEPVVYGAPTRKSTALEGKALVFTGNLSIDRDRAVDLAVAAGGKVTTAVSGKTTYLVTGSVLEDGRPIDQGSKFRKMKQLESEGKPGPTQLDEEAFLALVGGAGLAAPPAALLFPPLAPSSSSTVSQLWVDKYEPRTLKEFVGNSSSVSKLVQWLSRWTDIDSRPSGSVKPTNYPGRGGNSEAKAVLLSGSPGIGKSLLARLACHQTGFEILEFNASDYRSKSAVELIGSTHAGSSRTFSASTTSPLHMARQCLVMDECDGMSAGDRGGNQALIQLIKKSKIPIICICNDRMNPKIRSLANHCLDLKMNKPGKTEVVTRAKQILAAEGIGAEVPDQLVEQIVEGADCDIRQVVNQLEGDSFDWKATLHSYEKKDKSTMLTPFEACKSLMGPTDSMSINDRLDMFFVDYDLIPLLIQQNYPKCFQPGEIQAMSKSAQLVSFGDVISRTVRQEQHWGLLPEFGLIGSVFVCPKGMDYPPYPEFPAWLGKNSSLKKSNRISQELECVVSTASTVTARNVLKSNYSHVLYVHLTNELIKAGTAASPDLPTLDLFGVGKSDLMELLTELLLPWQPPVFDERTDSKLKAAITRICNAHHTTLKSGGAHFRHLKSAGGGPSLSLSIADERGEAPPDVEAGEEDEEKSVKKETEMLVKPAKRKPPAAPKKSSASKKK